MTPTREDLELYVTGNYDGDIEALERAIAEDPKLAAIVAEEAKLDIVLRDAAATATFCPACDALVRSERCDACGASARPGGYTVERVLVSNAHGRMYVARDADGKRVALKELAFVHAPSPAAHAAFEREAKFLRALDHPAIPRFCASFEEGKGVHARYYLAQELVEGTPLDRLDDHWYSEAEIVDIAKQVLAILVYLQSLSPMVIHRDIKPANLVKRSDGSIALVDFGAAHVHGTTAGSTTIGTFGYMPVEQLAGIVDATTDCYALGATLLYLLTRQEPWRLAQTKTTANVSAPLRAFLDKLIATNPRDRFASAKDALVALDTKEALVIVAKEPRARWRYAVAAAGLLAVGGGMFALTHTHEEERDANMVQAGAASFGTIRMRLPDGVAKVLVDGQEHHAKSGDVIQLVPGKHHVRVNLGNGLACDDPAVDVKAGSETVLDCYVTAADVKPALAPDDDPPRLRSDNKVSWKFNKSPFHDVMRLASTTCGFNVVVPDHIQPKVTINLNDVPCDQALEVLLEAQGLLYVYTPDAKLVRIGTRKDIDDETDDEPSRLPAGKGVDVDIKLAPLRDVLAMIASGEKVNLVVPDSIGGNVTIRAVNVPWHQLFEATLAAHKLGYRYRENGKIIVIAPLDEDDRQHDAVAPRQYSIDPPPGTGKLEVQMSPDKVAKIVIDGRVSIVKDKQVLELAAGMHTIKIIGQKKTCEQQVVIEKGESGVLVCPL
ncbi:MAG TPA: protein kinase [Kofleriaceae bacterium]